VLPSRDAPGTGLIQSSLGPNVNVGSCIYRESHSEPASSYIIKSKEKDSRTIVNHNELPEMTLKEFIAVVDDLEDKPTWCHFEGRIPDVTLQCITYLRQNHSDTRVSVEVEKPGREGLEELAKAADVVFFSKSWAQARGWLDCHTFIVEQMQAYPQASLLCCTWGSEGACAYQKEPHCIERADVFKVKNTDVVDSIGAGDTFTAGMLYMLVCRPEAHSKEKLQFANELAGRKVVQEGFDGLGEMMASRAAGLVEARSDS